MSLVLPPRTSPIRELIDLPHLASLCDAKNRMRLPTLIQARISAREMFSHARAVVRVNSLVLKADGSLSLYSFGPLGGQREVWKFGKLI